MLRTENMVTTSEAFKVISTVPVIKCSGNTGLTLNANVLDQ